MTSARLIRNAAINCQVIGILFLLAVLYRLYVTVNPAAGSSRIPPRNWYELVWGAFSGGAYLRWGSTIQVADARLRRATRRALLLTCAWFTYYAVEIAWGAYPGVLTLIMLAIVLVSLIRVMRTSAKPDAPESAATTPA